MARSALALSLALVLGLTASALHAEDEPAFKRPGFKASEAAPELVQTPAEWVLFTSEVELPAAAPTSLALSTLLKAAGIEEKAVEIVTRRYKSKDGKLAVVTVVGVDAPEEKFKASLSEAVTKNGWAHRALGSPHRGLIVWSDLPEAQAKLSAWAHEIAVRRLLDLAMARHEQAVREYDDMDARAALALVEEAGAIEPNASAYHMLKALLMSGPNTDKALKHFRKALDEEAPVQATLRWRVYGATQLGTALLLKDDKVLLPESIRWLTFAVNNEKETDRPLARFGNSYNLACALARAAALDKAFAVLEAGLEQGKRELGPDYTTHFEHMRDTDPDMAPLRKDERWTPLLEKYAPTP